MKPIMLMLVTVVVGAAQTAKPPQQTAAASADGKKKPVATAQISITSIKQLAELADRLDPDVRKPGMNKPQYGVNADTFVFYLGDAPQLGDDFSGPRQHPILIPMAQLIQIWNLRSVIEETSPQDLKFWNRYLDDAVGAVQKGLLVINAGEKSGEPLISQLYEYGGYINRTFENGAKEFAASRKLAYRRAQTMQAVAHRIPVSIVKDPPNARVFIIPASLYTKDGSFDFGWRELLEDKPNLGGNYFYRVEWPDGTTRSPAPFTVNKDKPELKINR